MIYEKRNYILMLVSIAIIIIGFIIMSDGNNIYNKEFNAEIFSVRSIVIAPIICVIGFIIMLYAILYKRKNNNKGSK